MFSFNKDFLRFFIIYLLNPTNKFSLKSKIALAIE